jgi:GTP pyrophosphokinase
MLRELGVGETVIERGGEIARLVASHIHDDDLLTAAQLANAARPVMAPGDAEDLPTTVQLLDLHAPRVEKRFSPESLRLARALGAVGEIRLGADWSSERGLNPQQSEALRKMLLAVASDPRLVLVRLAEQLLAMQAARRLTASEQMRLAVETEQIHAPLANRLGVWALKWELEDLAFRTLKPDAYQEIAGALAERRVDREQYIVALCEQLRQLLQAAGIRAEVYGRPKHIFSIWRKMQRKQLRFTEVYDVRALRIVVATISDCYAALGIVHGLWSFIPGEFDDYIATPKGNLYRSIHTAITGPGGKVVEIQIRTREMHDEAELGIAAHWRYKEGGGRDVRYEQKIEWARKMLDPVPAGTAATADEHDSLDDLRRTLFADRIYVLTPQGDVIDLPRGATALDFAYHVHTGLGHRCRGAKSNGRIITLDTPLTNGAVVEIIAGRTGGPSRDWLNPESGFLASARSRAKVRAWFHQQDEAAAAAEAPATAPRVAAPIATLATTTEQLPIVLPRRRAAARRSQPSLVNIEGVGDLPTTMARCCAPVPPLPLAGYMTLGRGVTIHRAKCPSLLRMRRVNPERVLRVQWNLGDSDQMPVRIKVEAYDRRALLRDVTDVLAQAHMSIDGVNSDTDPNDRIATIVIRTAVRDQTQLNLIVKQLGVVPGVLRAQRLD